MLSTSTDLICTEPSPKTPTEKFFESETKLSMPDETVSMSGSSECGSSPLSDASSLGYGSFVDENSQPDIHLHHHHLAHNQDSIEDVYSTPARHDAHILDDVRVTRQMLKIEMLYVPSNVIELVYCSSKHEIDEKARRIVTEWMLEVCEELKCEEVTFPLAVNYLDRFIKTTPDLRKFQLQLVAVVCLLIASKLRQCEPLDPKELSYMTDSSVSASQILSWEPIILKRLNWDVSSVLATDYLDHILVKLPELCASSHHDHFCSCEIHSTASDSAHSRSSNILSQSHLAISRSTKRPLESASPSSSPHFSSSFSPLAKRLKSEHSPSHHLATSSLHDTVRRHASTLISLCSTELQFACVRPSVIAAACVATAVRGIFQQTKRSHFIASTLASFSAQLQTEIDSDNINFYVNRIEALLAARSSKLGVCPSNNAESAAGSAVIDSKSNSALSSSKASPEATLLPNYHHHNGAHRAHRLTTSPHSVHSPIHSTSGYCPNACINSGTTSVHLPRCSPVYQYFVPTTQMISAKHLLLVQQQPPASRVHPRHHHIPAVSAFLRCSHPSVAHLHDSSNTSAITSVDSAPFGSGLHELKSKLVTLNLPVPGTTSIVTSSTDPFSAYLDEEDRENMAPMAFASNSSGSASVDSESSTSSMSANSDLASSDESDYEF